jgi:hypothetical protein
VRDPTAAEVPRARKEHLAPFHKGRSFNKETSYKISQTPLHKAGHVAAQVFRP